MMTARLNIRHIIALYNAGKLGESTDQWLFRRGLQVVRSGGRVVAIVPDIE